MWHGCDSCWNGAVGSNSESHNEKHVSHWVVEGTCSNAVMGITGQCLYVHRDLLYALDHNN